MFFRIEQIFVWNWKYLERQSWLFISLKAEEIVLQTGFESSLDSADCYTLNSRQISDTKRKHLTFLNFTFIPQTMHHFQGWSYEKDDKPVNKQFPMQNSKKKKEKLWNSSFLYSCFSLTSVNREHWSYEWRCSTFPLRLKKTK